MTKITGSAGNIFICLDALDEINDVYSSTLLGELEHLSQISALKVLISSRDNISLTTRPNGLVRLQVSAHTSDLITYLQARIREARYTCLGRRASVSDQLTSYIVDTIVSKASGMFLLAELQIRQLETAISERHIKDILKILPEKVNDPYLTYIERLRQQAHGSLAMKALNWIHGADRSLLVEELLEVLSVQVGDTDLDPEGFVTLETIMSITGGLLKLEKDSNTIHLVHATLEAFLSNIRRDVVLENQRKITDMILTYLSFTSFCSQTERRTSLLPSDYIEREKIKQSHRFLGYVFRHWPHHVRVEDPVMVGSGLQILERIAESPLLLSFIPSTGLLPLAMPNVEGFSTLHLAVLWARRDLMKEYLERLPLPLAQMSVNHASAAGFTALHLAALNNDVEIARLLIKFQANISATDRNSKTSIHFAASRSSYAILNLLLTAYTSKAEPR